MTLFQNCGKFCRETGGEKVNYLVFLFKPKIANLQISLQISVSMSEPSLMWRGEGDQHELVAWLGLAGCQ